MTSTDANKRVARRILEEVVGGGNFDLIDELVGEDFITAKPAGEPGPADYRRWVTGLRDSFPDLTMTIEDQIAEDAKVTTRFTARATHTVEYLGIAPTGRQIVTRGIVIHEIRGGKLRDFWLQQDDLGTMRQLTDNAAT